MICPPCPPAPLDGEKLVGVGLDLLSLQRMARLLERRPDFMLSLCDEIERAQLEVLRNVPDSRSRILSLSASLWTGKEAVAKALGTGVWQRGVAWHELGLREGGEVCLTGGAAEVASGSRLRWFTRQRNEHQLSYAWRWLISHEGGVC